MPNPKEVFDAPDKYWTFLTAPDDALFEGQHFDRKEAGRPDPKGGSVNISSVQDHIIETVSAFANSNPDGGLLVLGISKIGEVKGLGLLTDQQRRTLTDLTPLLRNHTAQVRFHSRTAADGTTVDIALIYVPETRGAICEKPNKEAHAWVRHGSQNALLTIERRDQLRRDKRITCFEDNFCSLYRPDDVDSDVLQEYRQGRHSDHLPSYSDEELLYHCGALTEVDGKYAFTNAGFLFFAKNPQRVLTASYVRLLKYELLLGEQQSSMLPTADRSFRGSIVRQIREVRTFFKGSSFFKVYQRRADTGGFIDDPEYPYIAIDEAIVNAIAHRDYAMSYPTECRYYRDAFRVLNAGRLLQRDHDVPDEFSLGTTQLVSTPRNPKLMDWLRTLRDKEGAPFVQQLGEGTRKMRQAMSAAGLPAPAYSIGDAQTTVTLLSDAPRREALLRSATSAPTTEYANLYPVSFISREGRTLDLPAWETRKKEIVEALRGSLEATGWFIDRASHGKLVAHRRGSEFPLVRGVREVLRIYPSYSFQVKGYYGAPYLCLDYGVEVKNAIYINHLLNDLPSDDLIGLRALCRWKKSWHNGKLLSISDDSCRILLFEYETEADIPSDQVIPSLPLRLLERVLSSRSIHFDIHKEVKKLSLSSEPKAARTRANKTDSMAAFLADGVFPLRLNDVEVHLRPSPTPLTRREHIPGSLPVFGLAEPEVEFSHHRATPDIREGITKYGSFEQDSRTIELVPICTAELRDSMAALIERLKTGKFQYKGTERTFRTRLTYSSLITTKSSADIFSECKRLVSEHPEWCGNVGLNRLFLVYTPEKGYSTDDVSSPYFQIKRFLLEQGIPCQMVDTNTIRNPDWKDLNLALNIAAKCGVIPWVLPDAIPDADFFVGLSYTQSGPSAASSRYMGYANVFNQFGRWEFYSGSAKTFSYSERADHFEELIRGTLEKIALGPAPSVYFHYSAKFSKEDREAIISAARAVRPEGRYTFVWINTHHNVRLYDVRPETDGSLPRGNYVVTGKNQMYLSTTGFNPYRKGLGTPQMLEINTWADQRSDMPYTAPDLKALATQILSLTKLNWASTDALCGEPITIKYAGDIAYLTAAFLRQGTGFTLHSVLERTPWFI